MQWESVKSFLDTIFYVSILHAVSVAY